MTPPSWPPDPPAFAFLVSVGGLVVPMFNPVALALLYGRPKPVSKP